MTTTPRHPSTPRPGSPGPSSAPSHRVLSARGPDDLLAAVPVVLGFEPQDSVVLMTFGGPRAFHARVDVPDRACDVEAVGRLLLEPSLRHEVEGVALLVYAAAGHRPADLAATVVPRQFEEAGVPVRVVIRADGGRWWLPGDPGSSGGGAAYDPSAHPFRVQSVVEGRVTHASRDGLAATLDTDAELASRVAAVLEAEVPDLDAVDLAGLTSHHVRQGTVPSDEELAAVVVAIERPAVRDGAWTLMTREAARAHVELWSDAVRRTPPDLVGGPAAVLGFAAWLAGHGALAWCAVDRARDADPDNSLARLVADLLTAAVPPSTWSEVHAPGDQDPREGEEVL